jgi:hypothetical protein
MFGCFIGLAAHAVDSNADLPLPPSHSPAPEGAKLAPPAALAGMSEQQPAQNTTGGAGVAPPASGRSPDKRNPNKVRRETEEQEKYRLIMERKEATSVETLCAGYPGACM